MNNHSLPISIFLRIRAAIKAGALHFIGSTFIATLAGALVFLLWYPHPYGLLSGGLGLFLILICVDVICGPLLMVIIYNPKKSRRELFIDISCVILIQLGALIYGMHMVYQARPLFLVHEVDRFRVIGKPDYKNFDVDAQLRNLDLTIRPRWFIGPATVGIRNPMDNAERQKIMLDSVFGGRDYAERPEFYVPYNSDYKEKAMARAKPLAAFAHHFPGTTEKANKILQNSNISFGDAYFLPVVGRQDWVAVLDDSARILGFLPGDGFLVP